MFHNILLINQMDNQEIKGWLKSEVKSDTKDQSQTHTIQEFSSDFIDVNLIVGVNKQIVRLPRYMWVKTELYSITKRIRTHNNDITLFPDKYVDKNFISGIYLAFTAEMTNKDNFNVIVSAIEFSCAVGYTEKLYILFELLRQDILQVEGDVNKIEIKFGYINRLKQLDHEVYETIPVDIISRFVF